MTEDKLALALEQLREIQRIAGQWRTENPRLSHYDWVAVWLRATDALMTLDPPRPRRPRVGEVRRG